MLRISNRQGPFLLSLAQVIHHLQNLLTQLQAKQEVEGCRLRLFTNDSSIDIRIKLGWGLQAFLPKDANSDVVDHNALNGIPSNCPPCIAKGTNFNGTGVAIIFTALFHLVDAAFLFGGDLMSLVISNTVSNPSLETFDYFTVSATQGSGHFNSSECRDLGFLPV